MGTAAAMWRPLNAQTVTLLLVADNDDGWAIAGRAAQVCRCFSNAPCCRARPKDCLILHIVECLRSFGGRGKKLTAGSAAKNRT
jgi:hypothetical protein